MIESTKTVNADISKRTFLHYTLIFVAISLGIFSVYFAMGGSFIWESDGFSQHFQLFDDYVKVLQGLFKGEPFPQWSWSIGPGADTITAYGYYVLGDPFVYLGVLFPESLREFSFHLLIFLRVWCVGLSYLIFARRIKASHYAGLIGAIMYTFSFYVLLNINRHPFFILPLIWFPLLCLGSEKIIQDESGLLFTVITALGAIANFYFFYKLTILVFIYAVVRYYVVFGIEDKKRLATIVGRSFLHYILGLLISGFIFLPMVYGFLNSSRSAEGVAINLVHYQLDYYVALIHNLFVPNAYFWSVGGFSAFTLFGLYYLWKTRKEKQAIFYILIILTLFLLFPFFGSMMNGFSGPYNRFSFAVPFFLSLGTGFFIDNRDRIGKNDLKNIAGILGFFTVIYTVSMFLTNKFVYYLTPIVVGWALWIILWRENKETVKNKIDYTMLLLVAVIALNMIMNGLNYYMPYGANTISTTKPLNNSIEEYRQLFGGLEKHLPDDHVYRIGNTSKDNHVRNQYIYHDQMGLSHYLSITNKSIADFSEALMLAPYQIIQPLRNGLDDRRFANYLMNVEYIITDRENDTYIPDSYQVDEAVSNDEKVLAKTNYAYPFAYVMNDYLSEETFSTLTPIDKEEVLSQVAVVEDIEDSELLTQSDSIAPSQITSSKTIPYNISYEGKKLEATKSYQLNIDEVDQSITISLDEANDLSNHELFISLEGMDYKTDESHFYTYDKTGYDIVFKYNDRRKSFRQSDQHTFSTYFDRDQFFVNLGRVEDDHPISITFKDTGNFTIDDIKLYALPINLENDKQVAEEKHERALNITTFDNETVKGTLKNTEGGLLVTSIPYEKGWEAKVNGEKRTPIKVNIGFVGIPLKEGEEKIELRYQNKQLVPGIWLTVIGLVLTLLTEWLYRKKVQ